MGIITESDIFRAFIDLNPQPVNPAGKGAFMRHNLSEVSSWMTTPALTIDPHATLFEAYNFMFENDVRRLPVVDRSHSLIGIITMSDVQQAAPIVRGEEGNTDNRLLVSLQRVANVMSPDPITIRAEESIQEAAERMLENEISGLPVVDGDKLVGIITESDIFRLVVESWLESGTARQPPVHDFAQRDPSLIMHLQ